MYSHAIGAICGCALSGVVWAFTPAPPVIDLVSVSLLTGNMVRYERIVNADAVTRAGWASEVIDMETEQSVFGCSGSGRTDYGPNEANIQTFPLIAFTSKDCPANMVPGRKYQIATIVQPPVGDPDFERSPTFIWEGITN